MISKETLDWFKNFVSKRIINGIYQPYTEEELFKEAVTLGLEDDMAKGKTFENLQELI